MVRKLMVFVLALCFVIVTACGTNASTSSSGSGGSNTTNTKTTTKSTGKSSKGSSKTISSSDPLSKPTTLVLYSLSRNSRADFDRLYGNLIKKKFPKLTIKYMTMNDGKLPEQLAAGTKIDLLWGSEGSWPGAQALKIPADMTGLIKQANIDLSRVNSTLVNDVRTLGSGKLYGLPFENSVEAILYNKDIFDKFGVPYPKDGMTWDQFNSLTKRVSRISSGTAYAGYTVSNYGAYIGLSNELSIPLIDPKTHKSTYDTNPGWKEIIQKQILPNFSTPAYLQAADKYRHGNILSMNQFLKNKMVATISTGPAVVPYDEKALKGMNWDLAAMPTLSDHKGVGYQAYPEIMSVTKMSQHKAAAMELVKYFLSKEMQTHLARIGNMTVLNDKSVQQEMGKDTAFPDKNYGAFFYDKIAPIAPRSPKYAVASFYELKGLLPAVARKKEDLNTALRKAAEKTNQKIQKKVGSS